VDDIKMDFKEIGFETVVWISREHDRVQPWIFVNPVMNLHIL
jgi:hypothetical protein